MISSAKSERGYDFASAERAFHVISGLRRLCPVLNNVEKMNILWSTKLKAEAEGDEVFAKRIVDHLEEGTKKKDEL